MPTEHYSDTVVVKECGLVDYEVAWQAMQQHNAAQTAEDADEIWLLQHPPVYTHGLNCKDRDIHGDSAIPAVACDRGGETTYHGPGQVVAYILMNLDRRHWGVKTLVTALEQAVIDLLQDHGIVGQRRADAPGVYVGEQKIAALGLRIKRGCSYHGIALNGDMDLRPFHDINPCGYPGLNVTQLADLIEEYDAADIRRAFLASLVKNLGYNKTIDKECSLPIHG